MESTEPVRVAVNIRPFTTLEKGCTNCITVEPNESKVHIGSHTFTYDFVFGNSGLPSSKIYEYCVAPLVESLFRGYNATVLAYGQTASGKTYTMGTNHGIAGTNGGIIPKVMDDVFNRVEAIKDSTKSHIGVSYIQIYNEEVFDLLASNSSRTPILIKQTASGEITLQGVTEADVKTKEEMRSYLARGSFSRATGSTNMNRQSSRSHAILTVSLKISRAKDIICAKIHLVDLAGSEGANRTGADGMRLKEGIQINKGLLALGNVISTLGDERRRKKGCYVPYRDSKLTRLLQDSLGGNSKTVMIACVSPSINFFEETLNTLRYANRARNIQNKAVVQKPESQVVDNLSGDVDDLNHVSSGSSDSRSHLKPSAPVFDDGAMFKERTPQKSASQPVYDKHVYNEKDVFKAFSELKIPLTSQSARFDDDFPSISSPSKHSKRNSSPFKKTESEREETVEVIDLTADVSPVFIPVYDKPEREEKSPNKAVKVIDLTTDEESPQENKKLKELEKRLEAMEAKIQENYKEKIHELEKEKRSLQSEELRQKCASTSSTTSSCNCTKRSTCKTVRCECIVSNRFCSSSCGCSSAKCSNRNRDGKLF